jgi:hypothetical protein
LKLTSKRAYISCPYHKDKTPSLVITLEGEHTGKWYCFSCGRAGQLTKRQLEGLLKKKPKRQKPDEIDWEKLVMEYRDRYSGQPFPVQHWISEALLVGWDGEAWTFPMRNYKNEIIGIQRRFPDGFKCCVNGSMNGLFVPQTSLAEPIYITEGASDLCYLLNIGRYGIGRINCRMIDEVVDWLNHNKIKDVIIVADNDPPGQKGALKLANILDCFIWTPTKGKDLREYLEVSQK